MVDSEPGFVEVKAYEGGSIRLQLWRQNRRRPSVDIILHRDEVSSMISELWTATHSEEFDPERKSHEDY